MAFALSRLTAFARGRERKAGALGEMPVLRRADAHPDAPPRRPIFANSDFGGTGMFADLPAIAEAGAEEPVCDSPESDPAESFLTGSVESAAIDGATAHDGSVTVAEEIDPGFAPLAAPVPPPGLEVPEAAVPAPRAPKPLDALTIAELAERFEHGLARRNEHVAPVQTVEPSSEAPLAVQSEPRVLADIPPAAPVSVKPNVAVDADLALREALGTLQRISTR
jgi:hypothetical protein